MEENKTCSHPGCKNGYVAIAVIVSPDGVVAPTMFCKDHLQNLGMDLVAPDLSHYVYQPYDGNYEEFFLHAILFLYEGDRYDVVLKSLQSKAVFGVPISYAQAMAIYDAVTKQGTSQYPLIHQLFADVIQRLGGSPREIAVYGYNKNQNVYDCFLAIEADEELIKVKCRVSDAIALSIHTGVRIKINAAFFCKDLNAID